MDNFRRKELCLSKYKACNLGNFSTFAAILKIPHPQCVAISVRTPPGENSDVYGTSIMKCPKCFWRDYYKICPICDHQIPEGRNYKKGGFLRFHDCGPVPHKNVKTLETNFHSPSTEENEDED